LVEILFSTPYCDGCHLQIMSSLHILINYSYFHVNIQRFHVVVKELGF